MFRLVTNTERYRNSGGYTIKDTLECGHTKFNKGSAGRAKKRHCNRCEGLKNGMKSTIGNEQELWNKSTQLPYLVPINETL